MTAILGISAFFHDSAAALVIDGRIVAAAQEERFSRKKHDSGFPVNAIAYCLREAGIDASDLDYVGFYDKPLRKFDRLLESYLAYVPRGFRSFVRSMPIWLKQKLYLNREIDLGLGRAFRKRHIFLDHHQSHAASAFFPSPFEEAAILTLDGVGEWGTASYGTGRGHRVELTHELRFPHSLGLLYTAFTYFTGFAPNSDEYKLMGLAPYGEPTYVDTILERLVDLKPDGSFRLDMSFFDYCHGLTMTGKKFERLFGGPPRRPEAEITQREMDLAASIQKVTEEIMLRCARHVHAQTGMENLCLAGGVALNCVGNGRILREGPFENIWIQPAADDAGGALGVALFIWHQLLGNERVAQPGDSQAGSFLGPAFSDDEIRRTLDAANARYEYHADDTRLCDEVADLLASRNVVGWFQGRMEFGPRALGARSILGDPRWPDAQRIMNQKVKFREGFRPFAPSVLAEHAPAYFGVNGGCESPYMLLVAPVAEDKRRDPVPEERDARGLDKLKVQHSTIPSVTHVDYSARIQTVDPGRHGVYRRLVESFHRKTGCPVLVNTSFNLGWDPIVCTPADAYRTFMSSDIDALCVGHFLLRKTAQPAWVGGEGVEPFLDLLASPCCRAPLARHDAALRCSACRRDFRIEDGIPQLFWPHESIGDATDVTEVVKAFYEDSPFPNYDDHDTIRSLIDKSRRGGYARRLNDAIPYNSAVLEVGCGTGQLSNFLGIGCRRVVGTDMCMNSLRLGEDFRRRQGLDRVRFLQMNLFRPSLAREAFDVVLCNGVLHHTADPFGGFRSLVPLVRPGGHIVIGLYNRYGRVLTDLRRIVFRATNGRGQWLDPQLRAIRGSGEKRRSWFADQYRHPHESKHTVDEVLGWFESCGIEFVRGLPAITLPTPGSGGGDLFAPTERGSAMEHFLTQVAQVVSGNREGGFFVLIGRKPHTAQAAEHSPREEAAAWLS
jgi:carbamoyltransferase